MERAVFFDLEGPLSPQDNAYDVASKLLPGGQKLFEALSRYDDLLALEGRGGYEPGDTLALLVPFILFHGVTVKDIKKISRNSVLTPGARELINELKDDGFGVFIISTSYEAHAHQIGARLGVPPEDIRATRLVLDGLGADAVPITRKVEEELQVLVDDREIKEVLDRYFFQELPATSYGNVLERVRVVGGSRKVEALVSLAREHGLEIGDVMVVGDSITDWKMLEYVRDQGGLSVVFNGNRYALPYGEIGLAASSLEPLKILTRAMKRGEDPREVVKSISNARGDGEAVFSLITPQKLPGILEVHTHFRNLLRGGASKLG